MKKVYIGTALLAVLTLSGCNDSFLEKYPVTDLTEENAFSSYNNFKSFVWPCYEVFTNMTIATSTKNNGAGSGGQYEGDVQAGYLCHRGVNGYNPYAFQTIGSVASGNGWSFDGMLRRVNIMDSHIDASSMTQEEKDHWRSVGYFFHSFWYAELINRFGDVPWIVTPLGESSEEIHAPREDRKVVADRVLERLLWAEKHIGDFESEDGSNTINLNCIRALISRFALREGTWRKYHGLGDYENYLEECVRVSELLMAEYPTLYTGTDGQPAAGYGELWTTEDLGNIPGIILYKSYVIGLNSPQGGCHVEHTSSHDIEMPQATVDLYLMKNGLPIHNPASGYDGDATMYDTFRNRDPRLYHTVMPPYRVIADGADKPAGNPNATWGYDPDPQYREYIDIMGANESCSNPGIGMKRLPSQNWSASLVPEIPRLGTSAFINCRGGYYVWKLYCQWERNGNGGYNGSDKPIFKIEEVLLNYAEAKAELGQFDQAAADKSINLLRKRADVAPLVVSSIDASFDPDRPYYYPTDETTSGVQVDPLLWEVRRERIIELMGEGFGFYDVRRWRMAPWFINKPATGIRVSKEYALANNMTLYNPETGFSDGQNGSLTEGYLFLFNNPLSEGKGWLEKYYLYQVPTNEILLNPNLTQNPGW